MISFYGMLPPTFLFLKLETLTQLVFQTQFETLTQLVYPNLSSLDTLHTFLILTLLLPTAPGGTSQITHKHS